MYSSGDAAAEKVRSGMAQSSGAITSVESVRAPRIGWRCWSMNPGSTTLPAKVSSTANVVSPSAALTSARDPTATIRLPATAIAFASGLARSIVRTMLAV